jgi:hypothetical protein
VLDRRKPDAEAPVLLDIGSQQVVARVFTDSNVMVRPDIPPPHFVGIPVKTHKPFSALDYDHVSSGQQNGQDHWQAVPAGIRPPVYDVALHIHESYLTRLAGPIQFVSPPGLLRLMVDHPGTCDIHLIGGNSCIRQGPQIPEALGESICVLSRVPIVA